MANPSQIVADRDTFLPPASRRGIASRAGIASLRGALGLAGLGRLAGAEIRRVAGSYCQVLAGTVGRLGLQAVYFFVLANTLSLHDMGVFASASAAGVMVGCFSGFGFSSYAFRASAGRRHLLGGYLGAFYVALAASLPLGLLAGWAIHHAIFRDSISLPGFMMIFVAEILFWRLIELVHQVNNGLGRYAAGSIVIAIASAARAAAALMFALSGGGTDEVWAVYYLAANGVAVAVVYALYRPRVRLRFRLALIAGRVRQAGLFAVSYFAFSAQSEIDKIVMLWLADERAAGIYAISMRVIDFTTVPFRTFYVLYSRKLIREGGPVDVVRRGLTVEAVIAVCSTLAFGALVVGLHLLPGILGPNVTVAMGLFGVLLAVPAFKNMLEFHAELFFAYERMLVRAVAATGLVALKALGLAWLLTAHAEVGEWGAWLNALYAGLWLISVVTVYRAVSGPQGRRAVG